MGFHFRFETGAKRAIHQRRTRKMLLARPEHEACEARTLPFLLQRAAEVSPESGAIEDTTRRNIAQVIAQVIAGKRTVMGDR